MKRDQFLKIYAGVLERAGIRSLPLVEIEKLRDLLGRVIYELGVEVSETELLLTRYRELFAFISVAVNAGVPVNLFFETWQVALEGKQEVEEDFEMQKTLGEFKSSLGF